MNNKEGCEKELHCLFWTYHLVRRCCCDVSVIRGLLECRKLCENFESCVKEIQGSSDHHPSLVPRSPNHTFTYRQIKSKLVNGHRWRQIFKAQIYVSWDQKWASKNAIRPQSQFILACWSSLGAIRLSEPSVFLSLLLCFRLYSCGQRIARSLSSTGMTQFFHQLSLIVGRLKVIGGYQFT
jgi:hypothetical protein